MFTFGKSEQDILNEKLFAAIQNKNLDEIKTLLKPNPAFHQHAASLKATRNTDNQESVIYYASLIGSDEILKYLLDEDHSPQVNGKTKLSLQTPAHAAANEGHLGILKLLRTYNAQLDDKNVDGSTPLALATIKGHIEIVEYLLLNGANPKFQYPNTRASLLHIAAIHNQHKIIKILVPKLGLTALMQVTTQKLTPLMLAAHLNFPDTAETLLQLGDDPNHQNSDLNTALHIATEKSHKGVIKILLQYGADTFQKNKQGKTPYSIADVVYDIDSITIIGDHRQNNQQLIEHCMEAVEKTDEIRKLLDAGAYFNHKDTHDETPMIHACRRGHLNIIQLFVSRAPQIHRWQSSLLTHAAHAGKVECFKYLSETLKLSTEPTLREDADPLYIAIKANNTALIRYLLIELKVDVNRPCTQKLPALLYAAQHANENTLLFLLDQSPNTGIQDKKDNGFLHYAAKNTTTYLLPLIQQRLTFLLEDINQLNTEGFTPLMLAVQANNFQCVKGLIELNAYIDFYNPSSGLTAFQMAVENKQTDPNIIKLLAYQHMIQNRTYDHVEMNYMLCQHNITKAIMCQYIIALSDDAGREGDIAKQVFMLEQATSFQPGNLMSHYMMDKSSQSASDPFAALTLRLKTLYRTNAYQDYRQRNPLPLAVIPPPPYYPSVPPHQDPPDDDISPNQPTHTQAPLVFNPPNVDISRHRVEVFEFNRKKG